jgi:2-haloacid dehalogenase
VFDVDETLLDPAALDSYFERVFGDAGARRAWFNQMIRRPGQGRRRHAGVDK